MLNGFKEKEGTKTVSREQENVKSYPSDLKKGPTG